MKNRAIKFRMWNNCPPEYGSSKYFYDVDQVMECLKQQMAYDTNDHSTIPYDHVGEGNAFEQFTGLHDKNGVEIYEGDILHLDYQDRVFSIEWEPEYCCHNFYIMTKTKKQGLSVCKSIETAVEVTKINLQDQITVIGNIHQNPELL